MKGDLSIAYDMSLDSASVLYNSLVEAKVALQKASSKIASFKGDTETLKYRDLLQTLQIQYMIT